MGGANIRSILGDYAAGGPDVFAISLTICSSSLVKDNIDFWLTCSWAFMGAITDALAGRASDSGILRGAGLGALAGATLSVEVLVASCVYWCQELYGSRNSSMADFMKELLRGRFAEERFPPEVVTLYHWQVTVSELRPVEVLDSNDEIAYKGLSKHSVRCLRCHEITNETKPTQTICCTICLQVPFLLKII
ncbi:NEP1-interacting protein-like 2 [Cynara cardunculus var. scolymus]|uniref:NEP1-interacting protein-like 2 n=1 Tax=Cynara cardunculus var. scolymus TaxID=59895 RepID=UPI000D62B381|nr:NEP1-interacting protein-like 2 [Cynara cardunculus var. scolymus]